MKIVLRINLSKENLESLENVAKETDMTVSQVAKKFSKDPYLLEILGDFFGPLINRIHKNKKLESQKG